MNKIRETIYLIFLVVPVFFVISKQMVIKADRNSEILSTFSEWQKNGKPVIVHTIERKDIPKYIKITAWQISPHVFEVLGGYAPTFGIIGAVLGLIHVMSNITNPSQLGYGISTAFVATIYGVGAANMIFLPIAGKLKMQLREKIILRKIISEGVLSIHKCENPIITKEKLFSFVR